VDFVIVLCQRGNAKDQCLVVVKDKPAWQDGKLNLPGGKIEEGETPEEAATRELMEESGYEPIVPVRLMGTLQDGFDRIYCCKAVVNFRDPPQPRPEETQEILWMDWPQLRLDKRLIPNLRMIIPLVQAGVDGWFMGDTYRGTDGKLHTVSMAVPTHEDRTSNKEDYPSEV
jgi:8-oxo-dGTP pyrophosphatase MutT (NUDIX family)